MVMALLASRFSGLAGRQFLRGGFGGIRRFGLPGAVGVGGGFLGSGLGGGGDEPRRRRRRKALTNDDVRTALTIASAISKKAAENFILMRVRGQ